MPTSSIILKNSSAKKAKKGKAKVNVPHKEQQTSESDMTFLKATLVSLRDDLARQFVENTRRFDWIETKFTGIDMQFKKIDECFRIIDERFEKVDLKFNDLANITVKGFDAIYVHIDNEIKGVNARIFSLEKSVQDLIKSKSSNYANTDIE